METFDHIHYERTGSDGPDHRLQRLLWTLSVSLSPIDMKSIISVIDHKGDLEVTLDNVIISYLNSETNKEQQYFIERKIKEAWEILGEYNVSFKYQDLSI